MSTLVFLKLGGSLLTDKSKPATLRAEVLQQAAAEIAAARKAQPNLRILLGHGSGSFGHVPAKQHGTRDGVRTAEQWSGFVEVWRQAAALNRAVMDALAMAGEPAIAIPPLACVSAAAGRVQSWNLEPIRAALAAGILPVVYGDVVFDSQRGGTILSTEDLFMHLAAELQPTRILLAGDEVGVLTKYPDGEVIARITPQSYTSLAALPGASAATDVTGGMASKVEAMLGIVQAVPACTIRIFSGLEPGAVAAALAGEDIGTSITNNQ